ncbi:hypothetical protein GGR55DRAFT_534378 [Xylaria sp. FL0064]|nr:hypothetical protein GGR55DRAFT_534378 [Xylaria sp. FL0064]
MPTHRPRPRRHSLSSGDESFHPHPAKAEGLPRPDSRRRVRLPRSKSTSNVFDAVNCTRGGADDVGNVALEQVDIASLRDLANVLRTTGPPTARPTTYDDCLRLSGSGEPRRWSLQSLRRSKRTKLQRNSLQSHLPDNIIPGITSEGHRYNAISAPVLKKNDADDGPWFRSQYPVFLPSSPSPSSRPPFSPGAWPERSSSKAATVSTAERGTAPGQYKSSSRPNSRSADDGHSRTRALSNRVSTGHLLRAMLNPVDEGYEDDLGASLKMLGSQAGPTADQAQIQTSPLVGVDEEVIDRSDSLKQAAPTYTASATKPSSGDRGKKSPFIHPEGRASPGSPGRSSRRPVNIQVQASLTVPKESLAPESPGFPNMLATMTFPCPPKGSRPSSPASSVPSTDGLSSRPIVQPRTSSRHAATSTSVSTASLDEIVMQKRPNSERTKPNRPTQAGAPANLDTAMIDAPSGIHPMKAFADQPISPSDMVLGEADQGSTSRSGSIEEEPITPARGGGENYPRGSLASQLTATTHSFRQSVTSTNNLSRSSSASEVSTRRKSAIVSQKTYSKAIQTPHAVDSPVAEQCAKTEPKTTATGKEEFGLPETGNPHLHEKQEDTKIHGLRLSKTADPQPQSIIERRIARKARVREYKMRDLDASRADVVDSPVLGYFPSNLHSGRDSPFQGPSASNTSSRRPSTLSITTTMSETSNETLQSIDVKASTELYNERSSQERIRSEAAKEAPRRSNVQLRISPVNTTDIEPVYPPTPHWRTSGITMSPIMVVADVESRPGSPTLRFSTLARPELPSPRVRLKPLKINPHSRQKSFPVTISRNPTTGAIERSASVPIDSKLNRRSLMTMPTPPISPETTQISKRLSLPQVQLNLPVTPRGRTSPSRCQEWHYSQSEESEPEGGIRSTTLKERVRREKLQKEKEITDIVAKTIGLPHKRTVHSNELDALPLDQNNTECLENRLRRLERNNGAWLSAMKPLLEAMARTLDDMRVDDRSGSLKMSDFVIDMEAEARRVTHSRRGERENTSTPWQSATRREPPEMRRRNAPGTSGPMPLSPVLHDLDPSPVSDSGLVLAPQTGTEKIEESKDWSDVDPLVRELARFTRKSRGEQAAGEGTGPNTLNPLMRELMSASQLCAEEVTDVR